MVVDTMKSAAQTEEVDAEFGRMDVDTVADGDADVAAEKKIRRDCGAGTVPATETAAEVPTGVEFQVMGTEGMSDAQTEMETDSKGESPPYGVKAFAPVTSTSKIKFKTFTKFNLGVRRVRENNLFPEEDEQSSSSADDQAGGFHEKRRSGYVRFPTITDEEFKDVVDRIGDARHAQQWRKAMELVDFLVARKCNEKTMELKAQLQLDTGMNYEAVLNCERAIKLNPLWWEGHRTHGKSLLAFGQPDFAVKAYERALYINPADEGLRAEFDSLLDKLSADDQSS